VVTHPPPKKRGKKRNGGPGLSEIMRGEISFVGKDHPDQERLRQARGDMVPGSLYRWKGKVLLGERTTFGKWNEMPRRPR